MSNENSDSPPDLDEDRWETLIVRFQNHTQVVIIVSLSFINGFREQRESISSESTVEIEVPEGLVFLLITVSSQNMPEEVTEILQNPVPEIADRIIHRKMISISRRNQLYQIFGGPVRENLRDWENLCVRSDGEQLDDSPRLRNLTEIQRQKATTGDKALRFAKNNSTSLIAGTACAVGSAFLLPVALPLLGFTAAGVAAGSFAATAQSVFYGAFTGGVFSAFQSMGAVGVSAGVSATMAMFGFATGAGIGRLVQAEIIHRIPVFNRITDEARININFEPFRNLRSITILFRTDGGRLRIGFIITFTSSDRIYRYRLQFSRARCDFEIQVPRVTGEEWQEFIWFDYADYSGQNLEYIYVLKPRQREE